MRLFYLEPFLRRVESHFIEFALAVYGFLRTRSDIQKYMIGHKALNEGVRELFPDVIPGVSQTCFEDVNDKGQSFFADLTALDKEFGFKHSDLVLIPTAYENQVIGAALLAEKLGGRCPRISMHFHQLFPPSKESDIIYSLRFRRYWMKRLREAFALTSSRQVSYWTTESRHLNAAYTTLSGRRVGILPVPSDVALQVPSRPVPDVTRGLRIGYVGDGRQEKGPLHFLRASQIVSSAEDRHNFVLQLNNPRGFTADQERQLAEGLGLFRCLPRSEVVEGGLDPETHHALIQSIDILALPYNPANYWRRISGLLIQAALQSCVVIVSSGTWAAEALRQKRASGLVFNHVGNDDTLTATNLSQAILQVVQDYPQFAAEATTRASHYRRECRPSEYVGRILEHYGCT
jgi:hypothetical protein